MYQPFSKDDYIQIKDFEGFVKSINIRHTKLEKDGFTSNHTQQHLIFRRGCN